MLSARASLRNRRRKRLALGWAGGILQKHLGTFQTPLLLNSPIALSFLAKQLRAETSAKSKPTAVVVLGSGNKEGKGRERFSYPSGNHVCKYNALFLVCPNGLGHSFRYWGGYAVAPSTSMLLKARKEK